MGKILFQIFQRRRLKIIYQLRRLKVIFQRRRLKIIFQRRRLKKIFQRRRLKIIFQRRRLKIKTYLFNNFHFFGRNTSLENWRTIWNFWEFCLEIPSLQNKKNSFYFCQELSIYIFLHYTIFSKCKSDVESVYLVFKVP